MDTHQVLSTILLLGDKSKKQDMSNPFFNRRCSYIKNFLHRGSLFFVLKPAFNNVGDDKKKIQDRFNSLEISSFCLKIIS